MPLSEWSSAIIRKVTTPIERVVCPVCRDGAIELTDIVSNGMVVEQLAKCSACGRFDYVLFGRPGKPIQEL